MGAPFRIKPATAVAVRKPNVAISDTDPDPVDTGDSTLTVTWNADQNGTYEVGVGFTNVASGTCTAGVSVVTPIDRDALPIGGFTILVVVTNGDGLTGTATATGTRLPGTATPNLFEIPTSILSLLTDPSTGDLRDTDDNGPAINAFVKSVPNGVFGTPNIIKFPSTTSATEIRVDTPIDFTARKWLTFMPGDLGTKLTQKSPSDPIVQDNYYRPMFNTHDFSTGIVFAANPNVLDPNGNPMGFEIQGINSNGNADDGALATHTFRFNNVAGGVFNMTYQGNSFPTTPTDVRPPWNVGATGLQAMLHNHGGYGILGDSAVVTKLGNGWYSVRFAPGPFILGESPKQITFDTSALVPTAGQTITVTYTIDDPGRPGAYQAGFAAQHGFAMNASLQFTIENPYVHDIMGDYVYCSGGRGHDGIHYRGSGHVLGGRYKNNGRQAFSAVDCDGVTFDGGVVGGGAHDGEPIGIIYNTTRSLVDCEPLSTSALMNDIVLKNWWFGHHNLGGFTSASGALAAPLTNIEIANLRSLSSEPWSMQINIIGLSTNHRGPINVHDLDATGGFGDNSGGVYKFYYVDGIIVARCVQPLQPNRTPPMHLAVAVQCTDVSVDTNGTLPPLMRGVYAANPDAGTSGTSLGYQPDDAIGLMTPPFPVLLQPPGVGAEQATVTAIDTAAHVLTIVRGSHPVNMSSNNFIIFYVF